MLWVIVALSKFTSLIFNAELFSTLEVDWGEGLCVATNVYFHLYSFLPCVAYLLVSPHLQPDKEVKRSQGMGGPLFFRQVPKGGVTKLSRRLGSLTPFGEESFGPMCHGDLSEVAKVSVVQCTAELSAPLFCRANGKGQYILANLA